MGADGRNVKSISQSRNISAFVPAWSTVFRESIIELGSAAPFSVINPEDAVQIIGGRPVIGSENIRRHARRKVREPRPPQRHISFPIHTPELSRFWWGRPPVAPPHQRSPSGCLPPFEVNRIAVKGRTHFPGISGLGDRGKMRLSSSVPFSSAPRIWASVRVAQLPFADKPVVQRVGPNPEPHHAVQPACRQR